MKFQLSKFIFLFSTIFLVLGLLNSSNVLIIKNSYQDVNVEHRIMADGDIDLSILHINDLHGWLSPHDGYGGIATYMGYFLKEGFNPNIQNSSFLLLSGGDQNTGPYTATLSKGEAVIDVMNEMNFTAACIGNHEFDYGIDWMHKRKEMAEFPILSANIYDKGTTNLANFTLPYVIQNHSGVQVGIIGLTTTSTSTSAHPKYTSAYDFGNYETSLREFVPIMKAEGADIIIALAHVTPNNLISLAQDVTDLDISIFLGGHGGGSAVQKVDNSLIAAANHFSGGYVRINLTYNKISQEVSSVEGEHNINTEGGVIPDPSVQAIVDYWENKIDASEVVTHTSEDIDDDWPGYGIGELVTDGFIYNTSYNFGIANRGGGFRDHFRSGDISIADVVSVIPFENNLMQFNLTGAELINLIEDTFGSLVFSGVRYAYTAEPVVIEEIIIKVNNSFVKLQDDSVYTGVMIDYTWWVSYTNQFPSAFDTGIHYRETVLDYFRTLENLNDHINDGRIYHGVELPATDSPATESSTTDENPSGTSLSQSTMTSISSTESQETSKPTSLNTSKVSPGFMIIVEIVSIVIVVIFKRKPLVRS